MAATAPRRIVLEHRRAPGDIVVLTALVRDIALAHPGKFHIDVRTSAMDLWRNNPYVTSLAGPPGRKQPKWLPGTEVVNIQYGKGIQDQKHETVHFMAYFHRDFERQCKVKVPVMRPYPDLHLSQEEREVPLIEGRYWVVLSGGKSDFPIKVWDCKKMQVVADELLKLGLGVVQIGSTSSGHWHPPIDGALNLVGQTNLRDMMRLIHHADGVICGMTCAMHMAAALQRPCVVTGGGREAWWWEAYVRENKGLGPQHKELKVPHRFLHTIGQLDCCKHYGCWKNKVVPIGKDQMVCRMPIIRPEQPVPKCMDMITVEHVMEAVVSYYTDKTLPPISANPPSLDATRALLTAPAPAEPQVVAPGENTRLLNLFDAPAPAKQVIAEIVDPQAAKPKAVVKVNGTNNKHASAMLKLPPGMTLAKLMKHAKFEGKPSKKTIALAPTNRMATTVAIDENVFDHPDVGGKFTVFALLYGGEEYFDLHQRCLNSIVASMPEGRVDLRVGSNALNPKSLALVETFVQQGVITKHYRHTGNDKKYPVMREMFHDPAHPITTKWVIWFDDDSIADRTPSWLGLLSSQIAKHHMADNAHMFGAIFTYSIDARLAAWLKSRPWYHGKPFRLHNGKPAPNGNKIIFVTGGFWAATHEALVKCDIPDVAIGHNGGDWTIGEQLYQGGFGLKAFNTNKQIVNTSSVARRGITEKHPAQAVPA